MSTQVLVAYASKYGATEEIAARISQVLKGLGLETNLLPVDRVGNLGIYSAVILGSAVYVGQWHKGAVKFLQNNEGALANKKVWIFSSGPTGKGDPAKLIGGEITPPALKQIVDHIKPHENVVFHGFINPQKINFIEIF
jgi:menaquinone-dependent protoporphyrinogen oxidase